MIDTLGHTRVQYELDYFSLKKKKQKKKESLEDAEGRTYLKYIKMDVSSG